LSISIRHIGPEDAAIYRAIRLRGLEGDPRAFSSDLETEREKPLEWYAQGAKDCAVFVAFDADMPVGMAGLVGSRAAKLAHIGYLFGVYVAPEGRRRGIGDSLIKAVLDHARQRVIQIRLGVGTYNLPAIALYHRHGFEIYGTEPQSLYVDGEFIDEHLMVRFFDKEDSK
jgi:ribosomal protein S18 acetylase RimI-like enzyme